MSLTFIRGPISQPLWQMAMESLVRVQTPLYWGIPAYASAWTSCVCHKLQKQLWFIEWMLNPLWHLQFIRCSNLFWKRVLYSFKYIFSNWSLAVKEKSGSWFIQEGKLILVIQVFLAKIPQSSGYFKSHLLGILPWKAMCFAVSL